MVERLPVCGEVVERPPARPDDELPDAAGQVFHAVMRLRSPALVVLVRPADDHVRMGRVQGAPDGPARFPGAVRMVNRYRRP